MRRTGNRSRDRAQTLRQRSRELRLSRSRESETDRRGPKAESGAIRKSSNSIAAKISSIVHQLDQGTSSTSQGSNYEGQTSMSVLNHRDEKYFATSAISKSCLSDAQSKKASLVIRKAGRKTSFATADEVRMIPHRKDLPELAAEEESVDRESCENRQQRPRPRKRRGPLQGVLQDIKPLIIEEPNDDSPPFVTVPVTYEIDPGTHTGKLVHSPPQKYPPTGFVYEYDPKPTWPKPSYEVLSPDTEGTIRDYENVPGLASPWERNERRAQRREIAYNNPGLVSPVSPDEYVPELENWFRVPGSRIAALLAKSKQNESQVQISVSAAYNYTNMTNSIEEPEADDTEAGDTEDGYDTDRDTVYNTCVSDNNENLPYRGKLCFEDSSEDEEKKQDKDYSLPGNKEPKRSDGSTRFAICNDSPPPSSNASLSSGFQIYESPSVRDADDEADLIRSRVLAAKFVQKNARLQAFKYSSSRQLKQTAPSFHIYESPPYQENDLIDNKSPLRSTGKESPQKGFKVDESPSRQEIDVLNSYDMYSPPQNSESTRFSIYSDSPPQSSESTRFSDSPSPSSSASLSSGLQMYEIRPVRDAEDEAALIRSRVYAAQLMQENAGQAFKYSIFRQLKPTAPSFHIYESPPHQENDLIDNKSPLHLDEEDQDYGIYAGDFACPSEVYQDDVVKLYDSLGIGSLNSPFSMDSVVDMMERIKKAHRCSRRRIERHLEKYHEVLQDHFLDYFLLMEAVITRPGA